MRAYYPYLLFLALLGFSCEKWTLEEENFLRVEITAIDSLSIDSVRIEGVIKGLRFGQVLDHGLLWTTQDQPPLIFFNEGQQSFDIKTKEDDPTFSATIQLDPNSQYIFRAYATVDGNEYIYSTPTEYRTGSGLVYTLSINYRWADSLEVSGQLRGTEKGLVAEQHGFCWSTTNPTPSLEDHFANIGIRRDNEVFTYFLDSLKNNTPYYIRAYAIFSFNVELDTVYGQTLFFHGDLNVWIPKANFEGGDRSGAVGFSIGQKGYIGTGTGGGQLKKDFWEYDPQTDNWAQKADFPGGARQLAVGFAITNKGYIGTGYGEDLLYRKDFWEYDPQADSWAEKADFPGGARQRAVGFAITNKGYIGTGLINSGERQRDFWEYDPQTNNWQRKADFPGDPRSEAVGFAIADKGYIGTGRGQEYRQMNQDLWEYTPLSNSWTKKADFPGDPRTGAFGFTIGSKGYLGGGVDESNAAVYYPKKDFWEYSPQTNSWVQKTDFWPGDVYGAASGYSNDEKGYVYFYSIFSSAPSNFWEYDP
ncbi:MAG: hypothetical protein H6558_01945 [Lewinellaceae bacterium]|nr:hypothetical protein [Lewinellaceae bacterium]